MLRVCTTLFGEKKLVPEESLLPRRSVYGVLLQKDSILLVNTRRTGKYWFPGGVVEDGEDLGTALEREMYEETGLKAQIGQQIVEVESFFYYDPVHTAYRQHSVFFLCQAPNDTPLIPHNPDSQDEATQPQWCLRSMLRAENFQDYGWEIFQTYGLGR